MIYEVKKFLSQHLGRVLVQTDVIQARQYEVQQNGLMALRQGVLRIKELTWCRSSGMISLAS